MTGADLSFAVLSVRVTVDFVFGGFSLEICGMLGFGWGIHKDRSSSTRKHCRFWLSIPWWIVFSQPLKLATRYLWEFWQWSKASPPYRRGVSRDASGLSGSNTQSARGNALPRQQSEKRTRIIWILHLTVWEYIGQRISRSWSVKNHVCRSFASRPLEK